jgi:hypothetical protein
VWWYALVITATTKVEAEGCEFWDNHGKVRETFSQKQLWAWVPVAQAYNPSYLGGRDQEDHSSETSWANSLENPILKVHNTKRADRITQEVEHLPSKHKIQSSTPVLQKKKPWG